ncbi:MAG: polyhydroxyalkanoate synthesis repressor PhaR [Sneathiella sp.]|uniref:polyhydroxyalkanoate synthesis repressor PhaR n=1 Tax=Sneathiella sp. TaxID=1964365 RepID=UPI000C3D4F9F|nr:polyhydroxyalkanoate synthesis repressor PhaR [Sneathiella sp.]MAZ03521.1 polyhydroxyalkanoate synthesis repressor PhaR [Sneathiella sp.]
MVDKSSDGKKPIVIKKYANRRLYNTATSSYVTLDHLSRMVKEGTEFVVFDAKTNEDITRSVLTQIIFEEEAKGQNLLPINFLRQLISFYGDRLQTVVPDYLEMSMRSFTDNQDKMRDVLPDNLTANPMFKQFEEMGRKNMEMFSQAVRMFAPPTFFGGTDSETSNEKPASAKEPDADQTAEMMQELRDQLHSMQKRIDEMSTKK